MHYICFRLNRLVFNLRKPRQPGIPESERTQSVQADMRAENN